MQPNVKKKVKNKTSEALFEKTSKKKELEILLLHKVR